MERLWTTNTNDHYVNSLYFKNNGNIYLLGKDNNTRWSTEINLANSKPYMMLIQDNGNLAVFDKCGKIHWESRTTGQCSGTPGIYFYIKPLYSKYFRAKDIPTRNFVVVEVNSFSTIISCIIIICIL